MWARKRRSIARVAAACLAAGGIAVCVGAVAEPTSAPPFVDLTQEEKKWLAAHPVIRIGAETNYAPYEFQDSRGHFVGVVADYLDIIRYKLGTRFQVTQLPDFGPELVPDDVEVIGDDADEMTAAVLE